MSDMRQQSTETGSPASQQRGQWSEEDEEPSGSWVFFATMMLILLGTFQGIAGIVALLEKSYYAVASNDLAVSVGYNTWGWVHLIIGVVAVAAGVGLMSGALWARIVGIVIALLSAITNMGFLAAAPGWALMMIALDVLVIWAITAHGTELEV